MPRDLQPDNIFLTFTNVETLPGNNDLNYYYREGIIHSDGSENIPEVKVLNLLPEQRSRTTRIKSRTTLPAGGIFTTPEGVDIPYNGEDEIYAFHNYINNDSNINRDTNSSEFRNSWWYDTQAHRAYKVYVVLEYVTPKNILGQIEYDWRVKDAYIVYKDATQDTTDGVFTFAAQPVVNPVISSSINLSTPNGLSTWNRATLNLYKNNTIFTSSYVVSPNTINGSIELNTVITASTINVNDTLRLSVSVDGDASVIDPLIITEYSMSVNTPGAASNFESFLGLTTGLGIEDYPDCIPNLNNADKSRLSLFVENVDYSNGSSISGSGILLPQNINLLRQNKADKASVPDSNYSQKSFTGIRYDGSKTTRDKVNEFSLNDNSDNLGSIPNVELKDVYIGYFSRLIDPYPNLNKKTSFYVKYLINKDSDVSDPSLSDVNLSNLKNTFKLRSTDGTATKVRVSIQNIDESKELKNLEEVLPPVFEVGAFPTPVLYSQTSSRDHIPSSEGITLLGVTNETATGPWWSVNPLNPRELICESSVLINTYNSGYFMESLDYTPGENTDYPGGVEPDFTNFDPINTQWSLISQSISNGKVVRGDEFRFDNNEDTSYEVIDINYIPGISLSVSLNKEVSTSSNPNMFLIRRPLEVPNFVTLDIQKPYGFPVSASSSPGILATEYRIDELENNPDDIISSLIEKNLI